MSLLTHPASIVWLSQTSLAHSFNAADPWTFATVMTIHLLGLALAFGTSLILNLRLLGWGLRASSPAQIAGTLRPYLLAGLSIALLSGLWLFIADVLKFWANPVFRTKLALLLLLSVIQVWLLFKVKAGAIPARSIAALTLVIWLATIISGRLIGLI
ncbi:hypothetical protein [Duganella qianjiadongensis]|uniref:DUF2214 domain-containing protein n=1 Tax=Duganella qianjiadongensis TaxID=2692176 RepID=A0ABW9VG07_9BURK|nr:hypothetical protein [Duganella qianjiadongensis]MYM37966.1 hypothetical protein [Duganella qianjiadongensis]